jgi:hypothetical protein
LQTLIYARKMHKTLHFFSGAERQEDLTCAFLLVAEESNNGAVVDSFFPKEFKLQINPGSQFLEIDTPEMNRTIWYWIYLSLFVPWGIFYYALVRRYKKIVVFDSYAALIVLPAAIILRCKIVLILNSYPWAYGMRKSQFWITSQISKLRDGLGLYAAETIVVPSSYFCKKIIAEAIFVKNNLIVCPPSLLGARDEHSKQPTSRQLKGKLSFFSKESDSERELLCHQIFSQISIERKSFIVSTQIDFLQKPPADFLLYALSALDSEDVNLFIAGTGTEQKTLEAISVGLGLNNRVHFLNEDQLSDEILAISNLYLEINLQGGVSSSFLRSVGRSAVLVANSEEMREVIAEDGVFFDLKDVESITVLLNKMMQSSEFCEELEAISLNIAKHLDSKYLDSNWAEKVLSLL